MKRKLQTGLLICMFTVMSSQAYSDTLTVDGAIDIALRQNTSIFTSQNKLESARTEYKNRANVLYPGIQISSTLSRVNEAPTVGLQELSPYSLSVGVQGNLVLSPSMLDGLAALEHEYTKAAVDREEAEKTLRRDVKQSFYNLIYLEESIALLKESMDTMRAQYEQARIDYQNGRVSELNMLNTKVAYKNMEPQLASLQSTYREALARFCLLIGLDPSTPPELEGEIELPAPAESLKTAIWSEKNPLQIQDELGGRFDLQTAQISIEQMKTNLDSQRHSGFYPSLNISASWMPMMREPFSASTWEGSFSDPWTDQGSVSVSVSLPVDGWFPGSGSKTKIASIESSLTNLRAQYQQQIRVASNEVQTLLCALNDSLTNIESLELNREVAARNYELSEDAYQSGAQDFLALQQAEDELNTAKKNLLEEKLNFLTALFDLEYALNTSTETILKGAHE